jgi:hypothetical protein
VSSVATPSESFKAMLLRKTYARDYLTRASARVKSVATRARGFSV